MEKNYLKWALFQILSLFSLLNVITKFNNFPTYLPKILLVCNRNHTYISFRPHHKLSQVYPGGWLVLAKPQMVTPANELFWQKISHEQLSSNAPPRAISRWYKLWSLSFKDANFHLKITRPYEFRCNNLCLSVCVVPAKCIGEI